LDQAGQLPQTVAAPALVPGRACGSCMMCCKVPHIEEFAKPAGIWCQHAAPGKGCVIYADRPASCRAFYCLWMQDARFGPEWKPDRAKFVVYLQRNGVHLQIGVDPNFPNAWTKAPYIAQIKRWAVEGAEHGRLVFVRIGPRMIAVLPDREVDMGRVDPEDDIVVSQRPGPAGMVFDVAVKGAERAEPAS
jgi:hypothetical protein